MEPTKRSVRYVILDALRGFALLGIIMANFPEFSLYTFLLPEASESLPTAELDRGVKFFLYLFIDGKFYTIFSLLFGIGFSIIITNATQKGANGFRIFYRRMGMLFVIGFAHLMLLWSGDILMLYAVVGMLLPLFIKLKDRTILIIAFISLLLPVLIDFFCEWFGWDLAHPLVVRQWVLCDKYGITEENFAFYLKDAKSYGEVLKFLVMGAVERMSEFVDSNRYFKVLGLFLIGYYIGRNRLFAKLEELRKKLSGICIIGLVIGIPLSFLYAWSGTNGKPFGLGIHGLIYFVSVYLTSFGYIALLCLLYLRNKEGILWNVLAYPGKMALTNYVGQSVFGIIIFYGVGFGIGATTGLIYAEFIAVVVFLLEILISQGWLKYFRFGPLEWVWRCFTYGKVFNISKET